MSLFQRATHSESTQHRMNATEFSMQELEAAAALARAEHVTLVIENLRGRSIGDITRLLEAGGHRVSFHDTRLN